MSSTPPLRVIVADDHPAIVEGIRFCLERDGGIQVVATANNTLELAEALDTAPCEYVFADVGMQGMEGESSSINFLRHLAWQAPRPKIIVVTMISHSPMLAGLFRLGVDALVDKRDGFECLHAAIAATASGDRYLSPSVSDAIREFPSSTPARAGVLSRREWEVFQLYASGLLLEEIAKRFGRSVKTVTTQRRSAMRKLGLESEAELIDFCRQLGLI